MFIRVKIGMMQSNIKVAVTGGIGSGKTTVCNLIRGLNYPVFSCDEIYSCLLNDKNFLSELSSVFGDILTLDGLLDRSKLANRVFSDKLLLKKLNAIAHPAVMGEALKRMERYSIAFCEVPLLFEGGYEKLFDEVIVVLREKEKRINSVLKRSNLTRNAIENRINSQVDYANMDLTKYYVLHNCGNLWNLEQNSLKIVQSIAKKYF